MFEQLVAAAELLVGALSSLRLSKTKRKVVGKALGNLYQLLCTLVENGEEILRILRKHNRGQDIEFHSLADLLMEQQNIIRRINKILRRKDTKTVLGVTTPNLRSLGILIRGKGEYIGLLLDEGTKGQHRNRFWNELIHREGRRLDLPDSVAVQKATRTIKQLKDLLEVLRNLLTSKFEIDEII